MTHRTMSERSYHGATSVCQRTVSQDCFAVCLSNVGNVKYSTFNNGWGTIFTSLATVTT